MATWNRQLGRAAGRLHAAYLATTPTPLCAIAFPVVSWEHALATARQFLVARRRGWSGAANLRRESFIAELEYIERCLKNLIAEYRPAKERPVPTLSALYDELTATAAEFDGLELEDSVLVVTTEPIELEDVELGRFQIRLDLDRIDEDSPYTIVALEPNPAASCAETTHPHVSGLRLCPGDGRAAIGVALREGRLFDFFTIVDRILHTYAEGSAYVELSQWFGIPCHDCDCTLNEDCAYTCAQCEEKLCVDCHLDCQNCGEGNCSGCMNRCGRCDERHCNSCLSRCDGCRRYVCSACLDEQLCHPCQEERDAEDLEANEETTEESPDVAAASPV